MEDEYIPFDWDKLFNSMSPASQHNHTRRMKVYALQYALYRKLPWMRWPILKYVYMFWQSIFEDGIVQTCKPRWGAVTFSYLNDGIKPTIWHVWRQLTHDHVKDKYTGIYPKGAPKNLKQAEEWDAKWAQERELKSQLDIDSKDEGWDF